MTRWERVLYVLWGLILFVSVVFASFPLAISRWLQAAEVRR